MYGSDSNRIFFAISNTKIFTWNIPTKADKNVVERMAARTARQEALVGDSRNWRFMHLRKISYFMYHFVK